MTSSTIFIILLVLLLIGMFICKQRMETFNNFKHLFEGANIVSKDGSYSEAINSRLIDIMSTSTSKPGKVCIETDDDTVCFDKTTAISAYTISENKDKIDASIKSLNNRLNTIQRWKKGTGTKTERLNTYLSKEYYPKELTYTKDEFDNKYISNIPPKQYLTKRDGERMFLPNDEDKDGYRYLLKIESDNRYYPIADSSNVYMTNDKAFEMLEPRVVPSNVDDLRYADIFVSKRFVDQYPAFARYKSDFVYKLSETLREQERRYQEELSILASQRAAAAATLSETRSSILADINSTKNKCDTAKANGYIAKIRGYKTTAAPLISSMESKTRSAPASSSTIMQDARYAQTQILEQESYAENALPKIADYVSGVPGYIRRVQDAATIIELTGISQEYSTDIKECEQYLFNMESGENIAKTAVDLIDSRKTSLDLEISRQTAEDAQLAQKEDICTRISTINTSCSMFGFNIIVLSIDTDIRSMKTDMYQNYNIYGPELSQYTPVSGITSAEATTLVTTYIRPMEAYKNEVIAKQTSAQTIKNDLQNIYNNSCTGNTASITVANLSLSLTNANSKQTEFNRIYTACTTIRTDSINLKQQFYTRLDQLIRST